MQMRNYIYDCSEFYPPGLFGLIFPFGASCQLGFHNLRMRTMRNLRIRTGIRIDGRDVHLRRP